MLRIELSPAFLRHSSVPVQKPRGDNDEPCRRIQIANGVSSIGNAFLGSQIQGRDSRARKAYDIRSTENTPKSSLQSATYCARCSDNDTETSRRKGRQRRVFTHVRYAAWCLRPPETLLSAFLLNSRTVRTNATKIREKQKIPA